MYQSMKAFSSLTRVKLPKIKAAVSKAYFAQKANDRKNATLEQKQMSFMRKTNLNLFYGINNKKKMLMSKKNRW